MEKRTAMTPLDREGFVEKWGGEVNFDKDGKLDYETSDNEMRADLDALLAAERERCAKRMDERAAFHRADQTSWGWRELAYEYENQAVSIRAGKER